MQSKALQRVPKRASECRRASSTTFNPLVDGAIGSRPTNLKGQVVDPDGIIAPAELQELVQELIQPTDSINPTSKIVIS